MSKTTYYTDKEAQNKLMELFTQGKGIMTLKDDPKCPPAFKDKLEKLSSLHLETVTTLMANKTKKGASYEA